MVDSFHPPKELTIADRKVPNGADFLFFGARSGRKIYGNPVKRLTIYVPLSIESLERKTSTRVAEGTPILRISNDPMEAAAFEI